MYLVAIRVLQRKDLQCAGATLNVSKCQHLKPSRTGSNTKSSRMETTAGSKVVDSEDGVPERITPISTDSLDVGVPNEHVLSGASGQREPISESGRQTEGGIIRGVEDQLLISFDSDDGKTGCNLWLRLLLLLCLLWSIFVHQLDARNKYSLNTKFVWLSTLDS